MSVRNIWGWWIRINTPIWFGFELGTPRIDKSIKKDVELGVMGLCKGVAAGIFPPLGILYVYKVYKNWDSSRELD